MMSNRSSEQPSSTAPSSCVEVVAFGDLSDMEQQKVAEKIAYVTSHPDENGKMPQMLPVDKKTVMARVGFVAYVNDNFAGYIGMMSPEPSQQNPGQGMSEVGSLWVEAKYRRHMAPGDTLDDMTPDEKRRRSVAGQLVRAATQAVLTEGNTPYAFCNGNSKHLFDSWRYVPSTLDDVPKVAAELCGDCPMKPKDQRSCCDTVMVGDVSNSLY